MLSAKRAVTASVGSQTCCSASYAFSATRRFRRRMFNGSDRVTAGNGVVRVRRPTDLELSRYGEARLQNLVTAVIYRHQDEIASPSIARKPAPPAPAQKSRFAAAGFTDQAEGFAFFDLVTARAARFSAHRAGASAVPFCRVLSSTVANGQNMAASRPNVPAF